jgi:RNA polymerase sigma factor (sigma-70 family)
MMVVSFAFDWNSVLHWYDGLRRRSVTWRLFRETNYRDECRTGHILGGWHVLHVRGNSGEARHMTDGNLLAQEFEENRGYLRGVAYRMLGSLSEADDAVQESWLKLVRSDAAEVKNLRAWLTTVVAHVCLDMLRSRNSRREDSLDAQPAEPAVAKPRRAPDPEQETALAESVGLALLVVLDTLSPAERLAFVLHDMFAMPFEEIADVVGRSPEAARQLASRARRRVQGADAATNADLKRQREVVDAFLAALRAGDFEGLVAVLDPDLKVRADRSAGLAEALKGIRGARDWAKQAITLAQGARAGRVALINGNVGIVVAPRGKLYRALSFTFKDGKIAEIDVVADPERLHGLDLAVPND